VSDGAADHVLEPVARHDGSQALPARGYSWAPFGPGNVAALRHGAFSPGKISETAQALLDELLVACPWVTELDGAAVDRFTRAEARARLLHGYVSKVSAESGVEAVREYLWAEVRGADALADKLATGLGMTPEGRAKLARDTAVAGRFAADALAGLQAEGRKLRLAAEAQLPPTSSNGHGEAAQMGHTVTGPGKRCTPCPDASGAP
jgi:hypothetical protein